MLSWRKISINYELEKTIREYIHYYNHERIKVKLQGLSPVQYRNQFIKTA
ncbi:integrase core domain protein [Acinetobacter baumannii 1293320]|nr:integrase core domain protein [Acinetobacter baumannii 1293320]